MKRVESDESLISLLHRCLDNDPEVQEYLKKRKKQTYTADAEQERDAREDETPDVQFSLLEIASAYAMTLDDKAQMTKKLYGNNGLGFHKNLRQVLQEQANKQEHDQQTKNKSTSCLHNNCVHQ